MCIISYLEQQCTSYGQKIRCKIYIYGINSRMLRYQSYPQAFLAFLRGGPPNSILLNFSTISMQEYQRAFLAFLEDAP